MFHPKAVLFGVVAALASSGAPSFADQDFRACAGEYDSKCPVAHNAWFGCGTPPEQMAKNLCAVHYPNGTTKHSPFRYVHQGSHDGNKCGYEWYLITCIGDPE
jgi:hypothetical protein